MKSKSQITESFEDRLMLAHVIQAKTGLTHGPFDVAFRVIVKAIECQQSVLVSKEATSVVS